MRDIPTICANWKESGEFQAPDITHATVMIAYPDMKTEVAMAVCGEKHSYMDPIQITCENTSVRGIHRQFPRYVPIFPLVQLIFRHIILYISATATPEATTDQLILTQLLATNSWDERNLIGPAADIEPVEEGSIAWRPGNQHLITLDKYFSSSLLLHQCSPNVFFLIFL